jgi:hypothetical protein
VIHALIATRFRRVVLYILSAIAVGVILGTIAAGGIS